MGIKIKEFSKIPKMNQSILIEGLPGIGNVGKIAADFIVDSLKAKKLYEITSDSFPHSVFVNEKNLVDLPSIQLYYKKTKENNLLILSGDIQPLDERSCYEFCEEILKLLEKLNGKEIVTLGGIGLPKIPKKPKVYCTANKKRIIDKYKTKNLNPNIFGVVGPIVGVTGLLIGLASQKNLDAIALLSQTYTHPAYLGIKGARELLKILNQRFNLDLDLDQLDEEIEEMEQELKTTQEISEVQKKPKQTTHDVSYIG